MEHPRQSTVALDAGTGLNFGVSCIAYEFQGARDGFVSLNIITFSVNRFILAPWFGISALYETFQAEETM